MKSATLLSTIVSLVIYSSLAVAGGQQVQKGAIAHEAKAGQAVPQSGIGAARALQRAAARHAGLASVRRGQSSFGRGHRLQANHEALAKAALDRGRLIDAAPGAGTGASGLLNDPKVNPRLDWIKHQFTRQMEMDRFMQSPAQDMIDWGPAGPGPDREPPCGNSDALVEYYQRDQMSNLLSPANRDWNGEGGWGKWSGLPAVVDKFTNIWESSDDLYPTPPSMNEECDSSGKGGGKDSGGKEGSAKTTAKEEQAQKDLDEEAGIEAEHSKDNDPEGDDPDEFHAPVHRSAGEAAVMIEADAMMGHQSAPDNPISNGQGQPVITRSVDEGEEGDGGGLGEIGRQHTTGSPIPEDGQPDELANPAAAAVVSHIMAGSHSHQPEPGGGDPGDPRANEGSVNAMPLIGAVASPADGGQGDEPLPPGPEY